jgi:hypothetical protein
MTDTIRHMREERFSRGAAVVGAFLAASSLCAQPALEAATAVVPNRLVTSERFMVAASTAVPPPRIAS